MVYDAIEDILNCMVRIGDLSENPDFVKNVKKSISKNILIKKLESLKNDSIFFYFHHDKILEKMNSIFENNKYEKFVEGINLAKKWKKIKNRASVGNFE